MEDKSAYSEEKIPMQRIKGVLFPKNPRFVEENILSALEYQPSDDDLILSSYPKTGSTWMQYIVLQILKGPDAFPTFMDMNRVVSPYLEIVPTSVIRSLPRPRFFKTHLSYNEVPKNDNAKYIYVYRDPRDTLVSYYHFLFLLGYDQMTFDDCFEGFLNGLIPYGDYFDHLLSWFAHKDNPNILFVCYEELKADTRQGIFKIAEFLGEEHLNKLKEDEGLVDKILFNTSFGNMKKKLYYVTQSDESARDFSTRERSLQETGSAFFRKGEVGDWKNQLTEEQISRLEKKAKEKLKDHELAKLWKL